MLMTMTKQFAKDVDHGLSKENKTLSSKYFYNKKGDELFIKIMNMPEYYLTRSEMEIFTQQTSNLINAFDITPSTHFELIELGAGDGTKTKKLLEGLLKKGYQFDYLPIDISKNALDDLDTLLKKDLPELTVKQQHGDYFTMLESLKENQHPKVLLFLGSNIGNMSDNIATDFLYKLGRNLNTGDKLLIGADLIKEASIVGPAYNDAQGITKAFNINLLHRMNYELDATFDVDYFEHTPEYNEQEGIARSFLTSTRDQNVSIHSIGKSYRFLKGERIHTETSRKYNDAIVNQRLTPSDFSITQKFTDNKGYFADYLLTRR